MCENCDKQNVCRYKEKIYEFEETLRQLTKLCDFYYPISLQLKCHMWKDGN